MDFLACKPILRACPRWLLLLLVVRRRRSAASPLAYAARCLTARWRNNVTLFEKRFALNGHWKEFHGRLQSGTKELRGGPVWRLTCVRAVAPQRAIDLERWAAPH